MASRQISFLEKIILLFLYSKNNIIFVFYIHNLEMTDKYEIISYDKSNISEFISDISDVLK
jgi:hypothetical protein